MYELIWNNEVIDTAENHKEALYLKKEYEIAFKGSVTIKKIRL